MPPDVLAKAGTAFFTTTAEGLGLSQCFRLVGRVGGEMSIASTEGEGTVVTLRLARA